MSLWSVSLITSITRSLLGDNIDSRGLSSDADDDDGDHNGSSSAVKWIDVMTIM